ncbi:MAG TPA: helix-turn-helix domain-containing protein [Acholeplasmataceae bacterium]|jgi:putative transcriptional regulator|nr:helix-turn-helix domain-containing protein [Acholeplasmataceae bacterium]
MIIEQVSNRIKNLRFQKNNMSQQELADLVGCSRQTINALENNRYSPSYILEKKDCLYLTLVSKR